MAPLVSGEREQTLSGISRKSLTGETILRHFIYGRSRSASLLPVKVWLFMRFSEAQKRARRRRGKTIPATCPPFALSKSRGRHQRPRLSLSERRAAPSTPARCGFRGEEPFARACGGCLTIQLGRVLFFFASGCALRAPSLTPPPRTRGHAYVHTSNKNPEVQQAKPHPRGIAQTRRLQTGLESKFIFL